MASAESHRESRVWVGVRIHKRVVLVMQIRERVDGKGEEEEEEGEMTNAGNINSSWRPVRSIADRSSAGAEDGQILCKHRGIIRSAVEIIYARLTI